MPRLSLSDAIRCFGPIFVAVCCVATIDASLLVRIWTWANENKITSGVLLVPIGFLVYLVGYIFYRLYRSIAYVRLMALHDRFAEHTARRFLIDGYVDASDPTVRMSTRDADLIFRLVMEKEEHPQRRLRISDAVHLFYQSFFIFAGFFAASLYIQPSRSLWFLGFAVLFFVGGWCCNNEVEGEERVILADKRTRVTAVAKGFGYTPVKPRGRIRPAA